MCASSAPGAPIKFRTLTAPQAHGSLLDLDMSASANFIMARGTLDGNEEVRIWSRADGYDVPQVLPYHFISHITDQGMLVGEVPGDGVAPVLWRRDPVSGIYSEPDHLTSLGKGWVTDVAGGDGSTIIGNALNNLDAYAWLAPDYNIIPLWSTLESALNTGAIVDIVSDDGRVVAGRGGGAVSFAGFGMITASKS